MSIFLSLIKGSTAYRYEKCPSCWSSCLAAFDLCGVWYCVLGENSSEDKIYDFDEFLSLGICGRKPFPKKNLLNTTPLRPEREIDF